MGPNGTGKSTLSYTIMGHPAYRPDEGEILLNDQLINDWPPTSAHTPDCFWHSNIRLQFRGDRCEFSADRIKYSPKKQDPDDHGIPIPEFRKLLKEKMKMLKMDPDFAGRYLNDDFRVEKRNDRSSSDGYS
jgi:Fe-S cluster assembly ATP-binding protein